MDPAYVEVETSFEIKMAPEGFDLFKLNRCFDISYGLDVITVPRKSSVNFFNKYSSSSSQPPSANLLPELRCKTFSRKQKTVIDSVLHIRAVGKNNLWCTVGFSIQQAAAGNNVQYNVNVGTIEGKKKKSIGFDNKSSGCKTNKVLVTRCVGGSAGLSGIVWLTGMWTGRCEHMADA